MSASWDVSGRPNTAKIFSALQNGRLKDRYTKKTIGITLSEAFKQFVIDEQFDDDAVLDEFGSDKDDESFFIDWLKTAEIGDDGDVLSVDENSHQLGTLLNNIWRDMSECLHGVDLASSLIRAPVHSLELPLDQYNILLPSKSDTDWLHSIDTLLMQQCNDLRAIGAKAEMDKSTCSILKIGKHNGNHPLLTYLVDAYNRYRIQRRKRLKRRYAQPDEYRAKFSDPEAIKFIFEKCKGFDAWIGDFYSEQQTQHFMEACQSSIKCFYRRLMPRAPMHFYCPRYCDQIDDSILEIASYIFCAYNTVQKYASKKPVSLSSSQLPVQIELVIVVRGVKKAEADDEEEEDNKADGAGNDDDDEEEDEKTREQRFEIGDIGQRLQGQSGVVAREITLENGERTMLQSLESVLDDKRCQRAILIVDRRRPHAQDIDGAKKRDMSYCYQPNTRRKCHSFEADDNLRLESAALVQNCRVCLIPRLPETDETSDINVNNARQADLMTLSFHVFGADEVRTYLYLHGWGTRFFLEDVKYFLPTFFVRQQEDKLRRAFEKDDDRTFAAKYQECKNKCLDVKFENFYKMLINDGKTCH